MVLESVLRSRLSYPDLAKEILTKFISEDEIPRDDLNEIVDKAVERFLNKNEKGKWNNMSVNSTNIYEQIFSYKTHTNSQNFFTNA
jgi:hypothetical protein